MMVRGDGCKDILSGEERAYIKRHPPIDVGCYMRRYVDGLKSRPYSPSKWVKNMLEQENKRNERYYYDE